MTSSYILYIFHHKCRPRYFKFKLPVLLPTLVTTKQLYHSEKRVNALKLTEKRFDFRRMLFLNGVGVKRPDIDNVLSAADKRNASKKQAADEQRISQCFIIIYKSSQLTLRQKNKV